MESEDTQPAAALHRAFERPAVIVLTVAQMLMGLGLALAIILKIYMFIFTEQACVSDATTLGNVIRCTPVLMILAQFLMVVASLQFAALLFMPSPRLGLGPLNMGLAGVFLLVMSGVSAGSATWQLSMLVLAVFATVGGTFIADHLLTGSDKRG